MKKTTKKKLEKKFKVGDFIYAKMGYAHYYGVVTEAFEDMIQIFGTGNREKLEYHEIEYKDYDISIAEKEKVRFVFDQELRDIEATKLKAEHKFKELQNHFVEATQKRDAYFGARA